MEEKDDMLEKVRLYYFNQLSLDEKREFENTYNEDPKFAQETDELLTMLHVLEEAGIQQQKTDLKNRYYTHKDNKKVGWIKKHKWSIAASWVVLVGIVLGIWLLVKPSNERIYSGYFEVLPVSAVRNSLDIDPEPIYTEALVAYENRSYLAAIEKFKIVLDKPGFEYKSAASLYLGISYMSLEKFNLALSIFDELTNSESAFKVDAYWYATLIQIKLNQDEKAIEYLQELEKFSSIKYSEKVKILLNKL